jgi:uncharacterized protein YjbJ (UPF0337 family)
MTHTITALFDDRKDAEAAQERLKQSRVDADHIRIHDKQSEGYHEANSTREHQGIWSSIKNAFLPDHDRHTYEEGVRRGGYLLTADLDDNAVADAVRVLEEANTIDIDERAESWRTAGWDYPANGSDVSGGTVGGQDLTEYDVDSASLLPGYATRDLDRSSSRVRTYSDASYAGSSNHVAGQRDTGSKLAGLANEGLGNVKQAAGSAFGNKSLKRDGLEQERRGEAEQGKAPD